MPNPIPFTFLPLWRATAGTFNASAFCLQSSASFHLRRRCRALAHTPQVAPLLLQPSALPLQPVLYTATFTGYPLHRSRTYCTNPLYIIKACSSRAVPTNHIIYKPTNSPPLEGLGEAI